jgi:hypothetical protein
MTEPVVHIIKAETVHIGHIQTNTTVAAVAVVVTAEALLLGATVVVDLVKVVPTAMRVLMV